MNKAYRRGKQTNDGIETLLGRTKSLQSLARTLVRDAGMADDLVQDTCVALLSRPPGGPAPSRAWFRRVLRNFVYMRHREDVNRRRRERAAACPEVGAPTPVQLLERAELQKMLIVLVLELAEPHRSVILLRFFEGMTPGQIASEQRVPVTTVRSRLSQALQKLRTKLETRHGGERLMWVMALAPLLVTREAGATLGTASGAAGTFTLAGASASNLTTITAGGVFMTTKIAIVLTAASVALLAFGWGLGRVPSTDVDSAESDLVTLGQLEDLDGRYREAMARIDALEEAWNKRRRLDQTLTALTEELRELGNPAARDGTNGDSGGEARQLGHVGVWGELLDLDLDDSSLWELLHFRGDFENMARFVDELESWCTEKLSSPDLTEVELARLEAILHRTLFRKGYIRFALGDIEEARGAFREQIAAVDELEEALVSEGKELKEFEPVTAIYRDRSQRLLEALDTVAGKPAPADFQLGDGWVTERRASLFDLGGKTVAVFFRRAGDTRSAGVMGRLSAFCASQPDMEVVTLCWHTQDLEAQTKKLRAELEQVNYQGIAGFDPDGVGQSLFQTYRAAVGSASLYILDSRGEVVWLMEDPRTQDFAFTKTLLLRIAGK